VALSDDDVREILRLIDETPLRELKIETDGFSLHVVRGEAPAPPGEPPAEPRAEQAADPPRPRIEADGDLQTIDSPMLGTFYRAEGPGQPPFVDVGSHVDADTTVCIIEVMKMMNSVPAGIAGTIEEVVPENAELVEYGAPLFRVRAQ
jgi:acetyl-CoA carboxylase biotin carboxyl carrier protein